MINNNSNMVNNNKKKPIMTDYYEISITDTIEKLENKIKLLETTIEKQNIILEKINSLEDKYESKIKSVSNLEKNLEDRLKEINESIRNIETIKNDSNMDNIYPRFLNNAIRNRIPIGYSVSKIMMGLQNTNNSSTSDNKIDK